MSIVPSFAIESPSLEAAFLLATACCLLWLMIIPGEVVLAFLLLT